MRKFLTLLLAALAMIPTLAFGGSGYRLLRKIPIPGDAQWDYISVDSVNRRVYVSHGTEIEVLDADTEQLVGKILAPQPDASHTSNAQPTHGAAVAPDLGRGFTTNGRAGSVTIFDLKTLKTIAEAPVGPRPNEFLYEPASRRFFAFGGNETNQADVIDGPEGKVVGSIRFDGKPEAARPDGKGHVFVNMQDQDALVEFDARTLKLMDRWPLPGCHVPTSMAIDPANQRIFIGCRGKSFVVVNAGSGKIITTIPIGGMTDGAAYDPETKLIFISCGEGNVAVIQQESPDKYSLIDTVTTEPGARTMALDLKTHKLFLSLADQKEVPAPTPGAPQAGRTSSIVPGTFRVLVVGRE